MFRSLNFHFLITNLKGGGAEKAILKIARILKERGHWVRLILLEGQFDYAIPDEMEVHTVYGESGLSKGWLGRRSAAVKLKRLLATLPRPDLLVSTLPFADEIASLAGGANHVVRVANNLGAEIDALAEHSPAKAQRRRVRYQKLYTNVQLVAVSDGVARDLRETFFCRQQISVIPNPFDTQNIRIQSLESPKLPANFPSDFVIHAGRFVPQKRHDLLLDAWSQWTDAPALVLLTNPHPKLESMIIQRHLERKIWILGFQPNPYALYRRARCLVLCSDHEGFPNVLLEALACGTPVISTNCPSGPSEILRKYADCLVPCNDPGALVFALKQCHRNPPNIADYDFSTYRRDVIARQWEALATPGN